MLKIYGIKNCDTIKKALNWLEQNNITYQFYDYKKVGVDLAILTQFVDEFGFENILNKRGTTWRKLGDRQNQITDNASAISLMQEQPSVIKRPLIDAGSKKLVGFNADSLAKVV